MAAPINLRKVFGLAACLVALSGYSSAQSTMDKCTEDAMLVFDGSTSMAEAGFNGLDRPRIEEARQALRRSIPQITPFRRMGLITYGPGGRDRCENVNLRLSPLPDAAELIMAEIDGLTPDGNTPLTRAVQKAAEVLARGRAGGTIVLVTDGKENCGGTPCDVAQRFATGGTGITVHVIGFQVRDQKFNWNTMNGAAMKHGKIVARCLADATGGTYVSTETTEELVSALQATLACPLFSHSNETLRRSHL